MDLNTNILKGRSEKAVDKNDLELKLRFRNLLADGLQVAALNGHRMRIECVKYEETHLWAKLVCKVCNSELYLDADKKWHKEKIFGSAALKKCERD